MRILIWAFFGLTLCSVSVFSKNDKLREVFNWKYIDYAWENPEDREAAITSGEFVPENNLPLGLEVWKNKLFITVPRWKSGVVATLNYVKISDDEEKRVTPNNAQIFVESDSTDKTPFSNLPLDKNLNSTKIQEEEETESDSLSKEDTGLNSVSEKDDSTKRNLLRRLIRSSHRRREKNDISEKSKRSHSHRHSHSEDKSLRSEKRKSHKSHRKNKNVEKEDRKAKSNKKKEKKNKNKRKKEKKEHNKHKGDKDHKNKKEKKKNKKKCKPKPKPTPEPTTTTPPPPPPTTTEVTETTETTPPTETTPATDPPTDPPTDPTVTDATDTTDDIITGTTPPPPTVISTTSQSDNVDSKGEMQSHPQQLSFASKIRSPSWQPRSPAFIPYPSFAENRVFLNGSESNKGNPIVSVFRVSADACDRLWVMDTGVADILGNTEVISKPRILIYNLNTDKLIKTYEFKSSDTEEHSFFANIVVDSDPKNCNKAFAYVPDLGGYGVVSYDLEKDKSKRFKHNYFHFDPLAGNMNVGGVNFQWTDGVFSIALAKRMDDGFRTAYFHCLASTKEFSVNTRVWQSDDDSKISYYDYKLVGDRGVNSQSSASYIHEDSGVMFYTQLQKDSVNCWNTNKPLVEENLAEVASDNETMIFTNDLKVDRFGNLWVLTDKLPVFIYRSLGDNEVNYRIFTSTVDEAIAGTSCAN